MNKLVMRFLRDNSGATAIEYGLIAAGIAVDHRRRELRRHRRKRDV